MGESNSVQPLQTVETPAYILEITCNNNARNISSPAVKKYKQHLPTMKYLGNGSYRYYGYCTNEITQSHWKNDRKNYETSLNSYSKQFH
jgi:hypothetical protein